MTVYEEVYYKENSRKKILEESCVWIEELIKKDNSIEKNLALAHVYYLREIYILNCVDAEKSCEYYEKVPWSHMNLSALIEFIDALKLCYKYARVVELANQLLDKEPCFELKLILLKELVDSAMVADGAMNKEEYFSYKKQLIELLDKEKERIKNIIP